MLGQAGSTPLDLFWDMVEEEERSLRGPRNDVLDVLDVSLIEPANVRFVLMKSNSINYRTTAMRSPRKPLSKNSIL